MTAASSSTSDGLRVENLRVERGGQTVVHSLSLQVAPGQLVGLLGPNGAGKSTAFHAIIGLVQSRSGTIHLNGQPLERLSMFRRARAGLGYMPQEAAVFEGLTVRQNLDAVMEVGLPRRQRRDHFDRLVSDFDLAALLASAPKPSLAGSAAGWSWRGRWRQSRRSSCSMNPSPVWIRSPSTCCAGRSEASNPAVTAC